MKYPDYLVHFNKNHSAKNGQFVSGDGDGDGISNDHANQKKKTSGQNLRDTLKANKKKKNLGLGLLTGAAVSVGASGAMGVIDEDVDSPFLKAGMIVSGLAGVGLAVAGSVIAGSANKNIREATKRVVNEHYDAPLYEAIEELGR